MKNIKADYLFIHYKKYLLGVCMIALAFAEIGTPNSATVTAIYEITGIPPTLLALFNLFGGVAILVSTWNDKRLNGLYVMPIGFYLGSAIVRLIAQDVGLFPVVFYVYVLLDITWVLVFDLFYREESNH